MKKFAFVSRHKPTEAQVTLATECGIELISTGDADGFTVNTADYSEYAGVICVHAAMAARMIIEGYEVGVFNNINRAGLGEPPRFETTGLYIYYA